MSTVFVDRNKPLSWRCTKGHQWNASLSSIKYQCRWCPECAVESRRLQALVDAQELAHSRGGTLLSKDYVNSQMELMWRCKAGHEWSASLNSVRNRRSWCPHCAIKARCLSLNDAQEVAHARGGACLSETYVSCQEHLRWTCAKGHEWHASLSSVKNQDRWCPQCAVESRRLETLDVAKDVAHSRGGELLSMDYVSSQTKLMWRCSKGHEWAASLTSVKSGGSWCLQCAIEARRRHSLKVAQDLAISRGGALLSTTYINSRRYLKWRCRKGHVWLANFNNIKGGGSWCPDCATGVSESKVRNLLEKTIFPGKSFRKCRPEFLRTERGGRLELDGYCKELGIAFEYQGEQHYNPNSWFHRGKRRSFENLVARDKEKADRCKDVGVQLLIVPHYEDDPEALLRRLLGMPSERP